MLRGKKGFWGKKKNIRLYSLKAIPNDILNGIAIHKFQAKCLINPSRKLIDTMCMYYT